MTNSPEQLLHELAIDAFCKGITHDHKPKVGETIMKLSPEKRELLKHLTSNDVSNTRWPKP